MLFALAFVFAAQQISTNAEFSLGTGRQDWSFVEVRPDAHLFYWLHYTTADVEHYTRRPLVIWLHGGPGGSATGSGNFEYFGPVDLEGNKRNNSWVEHVNMLFIDSPVGAGFSYVTNNDSYATNTSQTAKDLVACMKHFYAKHAKFVSVPLHIFSESYGGRMAPEFALELQRAVERGEVNANIKSVTVGNPFISTVETHLAVPSFLLQTGMVDLDGYEKLNEIALRLVEHLNNGYLKEAAMIPIDLFSSAMTLSKDLGVYNIDKAWMGGYNDMFKPKLLEFMRGAVTDALNITTGYEWAEQEANVIDSLYDDLSTSSIPTVEAILDSTPIKLAFYSGNLDCRVPTPGTINVIDKMAWRGKPAYSKADRKSIEIGDVVEGYVKSDGKFSMYWINRAGHLVPLDKPNVMNYLLKIVTNYSEMTQ